MPRRTALVIGFCVAMLPFGGTASASCVDDFNGDVFNSGATFNPTPYWWDLNYVEVQGTATLVVRGDALVFDAVEVATFGSKAAPAYALNTPGATTNFVTCVAG